MERFGDYVYPFAVAAQPNERFASIVSDFTMAGSDTQSQTYTLSYGYDFIMGMINSFSDGAFRIQIYDEFRSENLFFNSKPLGVATSVNGVRGSIMTGNGQNSFILPKLHKFNRGNSITIIITDLSGITNHVEIALIGYKIVDYSAELDLTAQDINAPAAVQGYGKIGGTKGRFGQTADQASSAVPTQQYVVDRFFASVFDFTMAGATYTAQFPVSTGFDFMWEILNSFSAREFTMQIRDQFVTEDFFTSAIHSSVISGNGTLPFILPRPYIFRGGTYITITITDTNSVGASTPVQIALIGYKVRRVA
jgi:hypothetical protein